MNVLGYFFHLPQSTSITIGLDLFFQLSSTMKKIEAMYLLWQPKAVFVLDKLKIPAVASTVSSPVPAKTIGYLYLCFILKDGMP